MQPKTKQRPYLAGLLRKSKHIAWSDKKYPDFLNAAQLEEVFWLVKETGFTQVKRAQDDEQIAAYMKEGDQMGYIWKQGFFEGADPR